MTKQGVITEALKLGEGERLELAELLYESLNGPADPTADQAWEQEISERVRAIDSGEVTLLDWAVVRKQMQDAGNAAARD